MSTFQKKPNKTAIAEKQEQNIASGKPKNADLAWTPELKQELAALFMEGKTVKHLAQYFERTEGAILSELEHQGVIDQQEKQNYR